MHLENKVNNHRSVPMAQGNHAGARREHTKEPEAGSQRDNSPRSLPAGHTECVHSTKAVCIMLRTVPTL